MSLYFATKCKVCAYVNFHLILNSEGIDPELGLPVEPCPECQNFRDVLYATEDIEVAEAYNNLIEVVG